MNVSFVPHWNNAEGGIDLDTSRCFMGLERFERWHKLLPAGNIIVGLDEHSGIIMDCEKGTCDAHGISSVTVMKDDDTKIYPTGASFSLSELGDCVKLDHSEDGIKPEVWEMLRAANPEDETPPDVVLNLLERRKEFRAQKNFAESDRLRDEISSHGWTVQDSKDGQKLIKI